MAMNYGYQYSDIMLAIFCVYLCGGDHIEDITTILNKYLSTAPDARIPSSDTIARGLKELSAMSIAYTSKAGNVYAHDPAMKLNSLMLDMALLLGLTSSSPLRKATPSIPIRRSAATSRA